jgi:hypothetical protein
MAKKAAPKTTLPAQQPAIAVTDKSVTKGIGLFRFIASANLDPGKILERAEARGRASILKAQAKAKVAAIDQGRKIIEAETKVKTSLIRERARDEMHPRNRDDRRRDNMEGIGAETLLALAGPVNPTTEPPDDDWIYRFIDASEDVGNEEMQQIWGKILAGEITSPGSFSYTTLETVKRLRREEADLFTRACSFVIQIKDELIIFPSDDRATRAYTTMDYEDQVRLAEVGLLIPSGAEYPLVFEDKPLVLTYLNHRYEVDRTPPYRGGDLGRNIRVTMLMSRAGRELRSIAGAEPNDEFEQAIPQLFFGPVFKTEGPFKIDPKGR